MYIHTHSAILLSHKKKEILPFATAWLDGLELIILSKVNQTKVNTTI